MNSPTHIRPVYEARWRNFRALLASRGLTITAAAERLGKTQGQVSHFGGARPSKVIGDQLASEIEAAFDLQAGSLDLNDSDSERSVKSPDSHGSEMRRASQINELTPAIVTQAEHWVRFEEEAVRRSGRKPWGNDPVSQPVRRAERLIHFIGLLTARGGQLRPEDAAEIIDAARQQQGERKDGRKAGAGET